MVGFNLLREMIVLARAHNDAIHAKLLGGVESGVGGLPQIVTRQAVFRERRDTCADGDGAGHSGKLPGFYDAA